MKKRLIIFITIAFVCVMNVKSQEKWNLRAGIGTNYAMPNGVFDGNKAYTGNSKWYPGLSLGVNMSYSVFPWLAMESGLNFERIRTGYHYYTYNPNAFSSASYYGGSEPSYMHDGHYSKNYLNIPLIMQISISPKFGFFGGSGYRLNLSDSKVLENYLEWNEWFVTGGFFLNTGRIRTSISYTKGLNEKEFYIYSTNRTLSLNVSYTLWKK